MDALTGEARVLAEDEANRRIAARAAICRRAARLCAGLAALLGTVVVLGWVAGLPVLTTWGAGRVAMQPWAAVLVMIGGLALLAHGLGRGGLGLALAGLAALVAAVTLFQSVAAVDAGIDRLLFPGAVQRQALPSPGRMAEISSVLFLLFFFALLVQSHPRLRRWAWLVRTVGLGLAFTGTMGYLLGATQLSAMGSYVAFALPTAVAWLLLYLGLNLAEPAAGWVRLMISPRLGGEVIRRLVPVAVLLPVATGAGVLGLLPNLAAQPAALVAAAMLIIAFGLCGLVGWVTWQLDTVDAQRLGAINALRRSEEAFRAAQEVSLFGLVLLDAVRQNGRIVDFRRRYANPTALRLMGLGPADNHEMLSRCAAHADGRLIAQYIGVAESGTPLDQDFSVTRNGRERWFRTLAVKLDDGVAVTFYDITEQRRAERALARTEARHRAVLETAVDAMVVITEQGEICTFNRAAERIFGYAAAEAIGQNIAMLMAEPDRSTHDRSLETYRRTGQRKIIGIGRTVPGRRKDGSTVPLDLSIAEWWDGKTRFFTGIMRDISRRVAAENALRASETRFRTLFDQAAVGIAQIAFDGNRLLAINRKLCDMLGYAPDELPAAAPVPLDFAAQDPLLHDLAQGGQSSLTLERQIRRKDGALLWLRITSSVPSGSPDFRISVFEDVTQQKETLRALNQTKDRLELALRAARAGLWEWNTRTNDVIWSQGLYEQLGLAPELPPTFETWLGCIIPEDREAMAHTALEFARSDRRRYRAEFRIMHPDRGIRWLLSLGERISPTLVTGINIDITPQKQAEAEAQRANRAKSTFLAAASHDLRQPVQAMVLLNDVLATRLRGHPAEDIVRRLQISVTALQMLLEGLLDVSRLDAGIVEVNRADMPAGLLLDRLQAEYGVRCKPKGLRFRVVPCRAWIHTDPTLLERILRNLIENAIRYTRHGSVLVGCRRRGQTVCIGVYDTGPGIPEDKQAAIFQEFYQLANPERDREKGLGLGLSIVSRLVTLLGHKLTLSSVPGKGSAFLVEVPLAAPPPPAATEPAPPPPATAGAILVIDDEALIRDSLAMTLAAGGWRVRTAADAREAVEAAARTPPDLILADYRLREGLTGISAAQQVEAACGRSIPTIVLTGDTDPERIAEVTRSGYQIAHKPVVPERLMEMVQASVG